MRPVFLEFCGIKSFSERAEIDFDRLLQGGMFGIFGDTGAGKSTILDCIGFALYGKVNRIGKDGSLMTEILNHHSESGYVKFTFRTTVEGERVEYRIERTLARKGTSKVLLYQRQADEKFIAIEEGANRVGALIEEKILGIGFDDFKKCIALPQGEFSEFLQSGRKDRLELVSKLFSLESYGYALTKKVGARLSKKVSERDLLLGELRSYEGVEEVGLTQSKEKIVELKKSLAQANSIREKERKALEKYAQLLAGVKALSAAMERYAALSAKHEEMVKNREALGRLQTAKVVVTLSDELASAREGYRLALTQKKELSDKKVLREEKAAALRAEIEKSDYDQKIELEEGKLAAAQSAANELEKLEQERRELQSAGAEYKNTQKNLSAFDGFDYLFQKNVLTEKLNSLPKEESFLDYVNDNFKGVILQDEYACFTEELTRIREKYPQTEQDILPLVEKYSSIGRKNGINLAELAKTFDENMKERTKLKEQLSALEVENQKFLSLKERERLLLEEGRRKKAEYERKSLQLQEVLSLGKPAEIRKNLEALRAERTKKQTEAEEIRSGISDYAQQISATAAKADLYEGTGRKKAAELENALRENGIGDVAEAKQLLACYGEPDRIKRESEEYFAELLKVQTEIERLKKETVGGENCTQEEYEQKRTELNALQSRIDELVSDLALEKASAERAEKLLEKKKELEKELQSVGRDVALLEQLKDLVIKDKFMEYVAVEYLQEIASNANNLLMKLTSGRYFLTYGEKNFEVGDNFNEGKTRGAQTLSGGEIFLVSLSLALSLSSSIQSNSLRPIEFFFLDEGFGTLDEELVDTVMDSLEKLKNDNFAIGIISHVGELKNRLESKIVVEKANEEHGSKLRLY